ESAETDGKTTMLAISVTDTGIGIKKEALPNLFDAFKRVDEEKNRHIEGTGLGLSIVKQLVELMGGTITVSSIYGEGSTFNVMIKQGVSDETEVGVLNIHNQQSITRTQYESSFTAPDARVLIVDDNEMNLEVEKKLLSATRMEIDVALSGKEALELTVSFRYDAILMDHLMPGMDGIECLENIRNQTGGLNRATPVIVLTANAGSDNRSLYTRAGFDGYLVKPVSGEALEDILMKHIEKHKLLITSKMMRMHEDIDATTGYARKAPVVITANSMCDLPDSIIRKLHLSIIPSLVYTEDGVFKDGVQMDANELIRYISEGKRASSSPPSVNAYTEFFAGMLRKAHHIIHIALTTSMSKDYSYALEAAKAFDNVTVINSECLSSSTGILVLIAYKLAQQDMPVEEIIKELEYVKQRLQCSFIINNTEYMARNGLIKAKIDSLARAINLHPVIRFKDDMSKVRSVFVGSTKRAYRKYIKNAFPVDIIPDSEVVFITYAHVPMDTLLWVKEEISKIAYFENVIFKQASAAISSNCGPGTFGILYFVKSNKTYNIASLVGSIYDEDDAEEEETFEEIPYLSNPFGENGLQLAEEEPPAELKWYQKIDCIDGDAAVLNSGSEEAFKAVLKIFYDSIPDKTADITSCYEARDWENYKIRVHALKSSAKLVGALALSGKAQALETAAGEENAEYIMANHAPFMADYAHLGEQLGEEVFAKEKEAAPDKPVADAFLMESVYEGLGEAAGNFDMDGIEEILAELDDYAVPEDEKEKYDAIREAAAKYDYAGILSVLNG
ncbi:MAG: DegV family EDD domain-containing protein, partial [Lachnospiraceae bacterium]|nr:DegV family EDD domain-containing protein [Lachnospiraceae bacterium]